LGSADAAIQMPEAQKEGWEYLLHKAGDENKLLIMNDFAGNDRLMETHIGHRAIGVVYNPLHERHGNYVPTVVPLRYDAFIYLDETIALHPLHIKPDGDRYRKRTRLECNYWCATICMAYGTHVKNCKAGHIKNE